VIGHSMGGFVVQKYLEKRQAPAGVLMGSVPPRGAVGVHLRLLRRHPWLVTRALITGKWLHCVNSAKLAREAFFSAHSPEAEVVGFAARFREESARAIRGMMSDLPRPEHVTVPLLVLGAGDDGIISAEEVRATARAYRTEAEIFPDIGHDMMLEAGWTAVADRIHNWLVAGGL
jgi:pimeloyl-ACP methyl ester carboxylesterase